MDDNMRAAVEEAVDQIVDAIYGRISDDVILKALCDFRNQLTVAVESALNKTITRRIVFTDGGGVDVQITFKKDDTACGSSSSSPSATPQ